MRTACLIWFAFGCSTSAPPTPAQLGEQVFEDPGLSDPAGQACADCHARRAAFRDPEDEKATSMGAVAGRFGARNAPTLLYTQLVPTPHDDPILGRVGGLFWDGRAATLEAQIAGPLLDPLEMNDGDRASIVAYLRSASYAGAFRELFGRGVFDDPERGFAALGVVLAAFERSHELAPFDSRYDHYLAGTATLTAAEMRGLAIFEDPERGACSTCHPSRSGADGAPPAFTNFSYVNVGLPRYANNKFYVQPPPWNPDGARHVDHGLATVTGEPGDDGKFRVPTLRNIARTAPYGHNGYFANLPYAVEFMANRDVGSRDVATCSRPSGSRVRCAWPPPEIAATLDHRVGAHTLPPEQLDDLVAFLGTLNDE